MPRRIITRHAASRAEFEEALRLVHERYVECGYMQPQASGMRLGVHYALPTASPFVAKLNGEVIATVTLFLDSELGLPLDTLYADYADRMRDAGGALAEAGMLADRRGLLGRGIREQLRLMRPLFWKAIQRGVDDLLITVNPKHVAFYERMLCFEVVGPRRVYSAVRGAPAVLLRLDLATLDPDDVNRPNVRHLFFQEKDGVAPAPEWRMTTGELLYFFVERTDMLSRLSPRELRVVSAYHPDLDLAAVLPEAALTEV